MITIQNFPTPSSVKEVRQFVGLASYYRRFINGFAKIAQFLHQLTQKDAHFNWSSECQQSFQQLKHALVNSPVLAYQNFSNCFTLETDASIKGLGAVLSQVQEDDRLHPVAYASRSLSAVRRDMLSQNLKHWQLFRLSATFMHTYMATMLRFTLFTLL